MSGSLISIELMNLPPAVMDLKEQTQLSVGYAIFPVQKAHLICLK